MGAGPSAPPSALLAALLDEPEINAAGALRWAFLRSVDTPTTLAPELASHDPSRRARALATLAEFAGPEATAMIVPLLADAAPAIRDAAALALGRRGTPAAVESLVELIVRGSRDVEAAEALGVIAATHVSATEILAALEAALTSADTTEAGRSRLTQALGEIPGDAPLELLRALEQDADRAVSRVATYLLRSR